MQLSKGKTIQYEPDPNKFDLVTHRWNGQGELVHKNLYRKFIVERNDYYERPVGSGNLWTEGNQPAGRVDYKTNEKGHIYDKQFDFQAEHKAYTPPASQKELAEELQAANARLSAAEAELAAIRKDQVSKQLPKSEPDEKRPPTLSKRG